MAALVNPPEPVSSLIAYGLTEGLAASLAEGGVGTIDKLGGMTPEQLQEIAGIDAEGVENIRDSVTAYYAQFEEPAPVEASVESEAEGGVEPASEEVAAPSGEELVEGDAAAAPGADLEPPAVHEGPQEVEMAGESDTILNSGRQSNDETEDRGTQSE
jgi:N utilization substance protein A